MIIVKTLVIFVVAVFAELSGAYLVWRWLRLGETFLLAFVAAAALMVYGIVQTFQPVTRFGRLFAAYAGVFLIGALFWGWVVEGNSPDRFDWIGAALTLTGVIVILWGRKLFA